MNGESLKLNEVDTLPAETGAVLKGSAETCTLNIVDATASTDEVENAESNALEGYLTETTVETADRYLVLGMAEDAVGFYLSGSTTLKANKAYLPASAVPSNVNGLRFSFGEATGIDSAAAERNADMGAVYDLSGRRVAAPASGIYVKDGKKIFIR